MVFKRILPLFCVLLLLSGCGMTPSDFHEDISQSVVLSLAPGETDPSDGLTAVIHNRTAAEFAYGRAFVLEIQKEDGWYRLPYTDGAFPEDALIVLAGLQVEHRFPLDSHFAPLKAGTYRILLEGVLRREDGTGEKQHLALVFTVAKDGSLLL
ncbi:MAG: hypothetical protein IJA84_03930 [Clostridia bacterium]|nr:hypothetical protein [Clostridia bacterium]